MNHPENIPRSEVRQRPPRPSLEDQFPVQSRETFAPPLEAQPEPSEVVLAKTALGATGESVFTPEESFSSFYQELKESVERPDQSIYTDRQPSHSSSARNYLIARAAAERYSSAQPMPNIIPPTRAVGEIAEYFMQGHLPPSDNETKNPTQTYRNVETRPGDAVVEAFLEGRPKRSVIQTTVDRLRSFLSRPRRSQAEQSLDPFAKIPAYGNGRSGEVTEYVDPIKR